MTTEQWGEGMEHVCGLGVRAYRNEEGSPNRTPFIIHGMQYVCTSQT